MWGILRTVNLLYFGKPLEELNRKMTRSDTSSRNICGILLDNQNQEHIDLPLASPLHQMKERLLAVGTTAGIRDVIPGTTHVFSCKAQGLTWDTVNSAHKQQSCATRTQSHKPCLQCVHVPRETKRKGGSEEIRQEADRSPVMAGGLFAVDRKWFWELGGYDPGLEIWGGEQYEISFKVHEAADFVNDDEILTLKNLKQDIKITTEKETKVWMCGGEMFDVPCSRVGHIYRKYVPYKVPSGTSLARNLKRVAETWMDEFAEYIYQRRPEYRHLSTGDISAQKELRKRLKCKDFKWFMAAVAWDVPKYYPPVEPLPAAWGEPRQSIQGRKSKIKIKHGHHWHNTDKKESQRSVQCDFQTRVDTGDSSRDEKLPESAQRIINRSPPLMLARIVVLLTVVLEEHR
ncbi:hypothetical protein ACRRTK_012676 [Alexandromys fortis]